jgi:hypothetical protein
MSSAGGGKTLAELAVRMATMAGTTVRVEDDALELLVEDRRTGRRVTASLTLDTAPHVAVESEEIADQFGHLHPDPDRSGSERRGSRRHRWGPTCG